MKTEIQFGFTNKKYREGNKFILLKNKNEFNHNINYQFLHNFDFVPKLIKETKDKLIWEFVEGEILQNLSNDDVKKIARIIKTIHNSNLKFPQNNLMQRTQKYLDIINNKKIDNRELKKHYQEAIDLLTNMGEDTPCHNDMWNQNIIKDKNGKLWVVDWEYATMGNKYFDIAYFMESYGLNNNQKNIFLSEYNHFHSYCQIDINILSRYEKFVNYITLCWALAQKELPFLLDKIIEKLNQ